MLVRRTATDIARCATESGGCVAAGVDCKGLTYRRGDALTFPPWSPEFDIRRADHNGEFAPRMAPTLGLGRNGSRGDPSRLVALRLSAAPIRIIVQHGVLAT